MQKKKKKTDRHIVVTNKRGKKTTLKCLSKVLGHHKPPEQLQCTLA